VGALAVSVIKGVLIAGLVVLIAAAVAFEVFCLYALAKTKHTRYLPKWAWAILICVSGLGGLAFLACGIDD
jgi:hypothetical protein